MGGHWPGAGWCSTGPETGCLDLLPEILGGGLAGVVFEHLVEGGFGAKAGFECKGEECFVAFGGMVDLTDHFLHAPGIDILVEIGGMVSIDEVGYVAGGQV